MSLRITVSRFMLYRLWYLHFVGGRGPIFPERWYGSAHLGTPWLRCSVYLRLGRHPTKAEFAREIEAVRRSM